MSEVSLYGLEFRVQLLLSLQTGTGVTFGIPQVSFVVVRGSGFSSSSSGFRVQVAPRAINQQYFCGDLPSNSARAWRCAARNAPSSIVTALSSIAPALSPAVTAICPDPPALSTKEKNICAVSSGGSCIPRATRSIWRKGPDLSIHEGYSSGMSRWFGFQEGIRSIGMQRATRSIYEQNRAPGGREQACSEPGPPKACPLLHISE